MMEGVYPFACPICQKRFKSERGMNIHIGSGTCQPVEPIYTDPTTRRASHFRAFEEAERKKYRRAEKEQERKTKLKEIHSHITRGRAERNIPNPIEPVAPSTSGGDTGSSRPGDD
jgi:hypothetical protein